MTQMEHTRVVVHTDGGARGNPGPAGIGVVIESAAGEVLKEISQYIGETTNNVAEYEALIQALNELSRMFGAQATSMEVEVCMDSELVVRQMSGQYKVKEPTLKEKFATVARLRLEQFPNLIFTHVRREKNAHADKLVNDAIDRVGK